MNFLLLGMPGSGKGTISEQIIEKYKVKHLSTGNLFRQIIESGDELGQELESYMGQGLLVPDELTIKILKKELVKPEYQKGVLFDGFPRTIEQAQALQTILVELNIELNYVIYLKISDDTIMKRLSGRRICTTCQKIYNIYTNPPKVEGICDNDGTPLTQRTDDYADKIEQRIVEAKAKTMPLIDYYQKHKNFIKIDVENKDQKTIFNEVDSKIGV